MATCTVTADDGHASDVTIGEHEMGNLQLGELVLGSWGASWLPSPLADRSWPDVEPHPPDEDPFDAWDDRPSFERHDAYGEDVQRLRRFLVES